MKEYNGSYQLGTLAGELLRKWVNGFRLKQYKGHMPKTMGRCCIVGDSDGTKEKKSPGNDTEEGDQTKTAPGEAHPRMEYGGRITTGGRAI